MSPAPPAFGPAIPILRMFDVPATRAFYLGYLGFSWDWEHRFAPDLPLYAAISLGGVALHLSQHHGDATPGSALLLRVKGIEAFHAALAGDYGFARPGLEEAPWGARILSVTDPAGNRLTFEEPR
ncbi:glyoxalase superfamily protein [Pararoseomonas sp. SCSIO 73927]|uniref:glyoxalase superfamily protein n=1 Tax=Pararoseomonas sp. SCSIO 73927 TaxID=3114537 RepID=UPI0030D27C85